jgi:hypothetical protein
MPISIDVTNENFGALAIAAGFIPKEAAEKLARDVAGTILREHGIVPPWEVQEEPNPPQAPQSSPAEAGRGEGVPSQFNSETPRTTTESASVTQETKSRRGRPPKKTVETAPVEQSAVQTTEVQGSFEQAVNALEEKPAETASSPTVEDVKQSLRDLVSRIDLDAGRKLLEHFGAKKASEVPADKIADFVAASKLEAKTVAEFEAALKAL